MNFETRSATPDDRNALYAVYASAKKVYIAEIWGWDESWQQTDFDAHSDPHVIQVAVVGDRIVAYIHTELRNDTPHVHMLCVVPEYQSKGIGSALLKAFIHDCSAQQQDVTLGVFKINTDARRFHAKLGFETFEATSTHYLMRRNAETID
jgi:ribosomal protein S18 acetylase RimI-like enzyme